MNEYIITLYAGAISLLLGVASFLGKRSISAQDKKIEAVEARLSTVELEMREIIKLSVQMELLIASNTELSGKIDGLNRRIQGTELGIARLG